MIRNKAQAIRVQERRVAAGKKGIAKAVRKFFLFEREDRSMQCWSDYRKTIAELPSIPVK